MIHDIFFLLAGIAMLIAGGNYLTDGATAVARRLGVSNMMIGLTVVAIGSSMPDLVVCLTSTISGKTEMALGDVVGANIFDILLTFGVVALIRPVKMDRSMTGTGLPMLALSGIVLFVCGDDMLIDNGRPDTIDRSDGLMMLAFMALFMTMEIRHRRCASPTPVYEHPESVRKQKTPMPAWLSWVCIAGGLAVLVIGGNWVVDGASGIALKAGLSESLVGLTVVAIGSASPDLAASAIAAAKGEPELATGNIVGSCVINVFAILGICATVTPLQTGSISVVDFATLASGAMLVWIIVAADRLHTLGRAAGAFLIAVYAGYMAYLIRSAL